MFTGKFSEAQYLKIDDICIVPIFKSHGLGTDYYWGKIITAKERTSSIALEIKLNLGKFEIDNNLTPIYQTNAKEVFPSYYSTVYPDIESCRDLVRELIKLQKEMDTRYYNNLIRLETMQKMHDNTIIKLIEKGLESSKKHE